MNQFLAVVAQLEEHWFCTSEAAGSSPAGGSGKRSNGDEEIPVSGVQRSSLLTSEKFVEHRDSRKRPAGSRGGMVDAN